jgi:hypothetical protein
MGFLYVYGRISQTGHGKRRFGSLTTINITIAVRKDRQEQRKDIWTKKKKKNR